MEEVVTEKANEVYIQEILNDYRLACLSREASLLGRKEVLTGKAKFGIFGDGKELAKLAYAIVFSFPVQLLFRLIPLVRTGG